MASVKVSKDFKIVIPKVVRESMGIEPGQKMQVILHDGRIELIPDRDIFGMKGFLKGIKVEFDRDEDGDRY